MARVFAFNEVLNRATSLVSGPPFSVSAWVNISASMPTGGVAFAARGVNQNDSYSIGCLGVTPRLLCLASGVGSTITGSAQPLNTWIHLCGVWASTTSRSFYVNGALVGSDSLSVSPPSPVMNGIGGRDPSGADFHSFFGAIAYVGVYNIALTQGNVTSLFTEYDPSVALPSGLISFPRLAAGLSPEPDTISTTAWTVVGSSDIAPDPDAGTLVSPNLNDPRQAGLPETGFQTYSYLYLQPWKSYMDTWTGQKFLDGLGVNFRPGSGNEVGTAQVLAAAGFTHARMEFGWSGLQYADDTQIGSALGGWTTGLNALKTSGIRPLILLNNNLGGICPFTNLSLTATATSVVGATTITVSSTTGIVLGKTGLGGQKAGYQVYPFIKSIAGSVCTLSAPLLVQVTNGNAIPCVTLKYHPLTTGGQANSFSVETMNGWRTYVTTICTFVKGVLGNNNFDVEVYNEDSSALDDNNFYSPSNSSTGTLTYTSSVFPSYTLNGNTGGGADNRDVIVPITVDVVLTSFPGVRIINGRGNLRPQDNAFNTPPGVTAFSRHNYTNLNSVTATNGVYGISNPSNPLHATNPPTNALYGYDGTPINSSTAPNPPNPSTVNAGSFFIPTFTLSCPESYVGMGMKHEWMCTDLLPFPGLLTDGPVSTIYRGLHWRGGLNPITGNTVGLWETETNTDRKSWVNGIMTPTQRDTDPASINLWMYAGAKSLLRMFLFYIHKGMQTVCAFADRNVNEPYVLSIIPEAFYTALSANGGVLTPGIQALAGPQITAMTNMTTLFDQYVNASSFTVNPLTVDYVSAYSNIIDFAGNGTAANPDWRHLDGFGVFPFHVNQSTYIVGYYVVTPDVVHNWNVAGNTGVLDVINYTMPDEGYQLSLSGMGTAGSISSYDPLTGASVPVSILSQDGNSVQVNVAATDYPRFLIISINMGTVYTDSPALSSIGNWVMQGVVFKVPGAAASLSLNTSVAFLLGSSLTLKSRDSHRGKVTPSIGSVVGLNPFEFLRSPASLSSGTVETLISRDTHRPKDVTTLGNTVSLRPVETHRARGALSPGTDVSVVSRDTHRARSFSFIGSKWEDAVDWESDHFWNESFGLTSWPLQVNVDVNAARIFVDQSSFVPGSVIKPTGRDAHRASGKQSPSIFTSPEPSDQHRAVAPESLQAVISIAARDTHRPRPSLSSGIALTGSSRVTHIDSLSDILGSSVTGLIKYRHQASSSISEGSVLFGMAIDRHRAMESMVPQAALGLNPTLTHLATILLQTPASSALGVRFVPVSRVAHRGVDSVNSGVALSANPLEFILAAYGSVLGSLVSVQSPQVKHLDRASVNSGTLSSLVSRDTHRAKSALGSQGLLGLDPILIVVAPIPLTTPASIVEGSALSLTSRNLHSGTTGLVSGAVVLGADVLVFIDSEFIGTGTSLLSSTSRVTHQTKGNQSLGLSVSGSLRDSHGASGLVTCQSVVGVIPTLTIGSLITLSTPVSVTPSVSVLASSRDTHQVTTYFSGLSTVDWESTDPWESADAWEAGTSVPSLVSYSLLSASAILSLPSQTSSSIGVSLTLKSRDRHQGKSALTSGFSVSGSSRDRHGAKDSISPGSFLGLNPSLFVIQEILLQVPASVHSGIGLFLISRDTHRPQATSGAAIGAVFNDATALFNDTSVVFNSADAAPTVVNLIGSQAIISVNDVVLLVGSVSFAIGSVISLRGRNTHQGIENITSGVVSSTISRDTHRATEAISDGSFLAIASSKTTSGFTSVPVPASIVSSVLVDGRIRFTHQPRINYGSGSVLTLPASVELKTPANVVIGSTVTITSRDTHKDKLVATSGIAISPRSRDLHGCVVNDLLGVSLFSKSSLDARASTSIGSQSTAQLISRNTHRASIMGIQAINWESGHAWEEELPWEQGASIHAIPCQLSLRASAIVTHGSVMNVTVQGEVSASTEMLLMPGLAMVIGASTSILAFETHGAELDIGAFSGVSAIASMFRSPSVSVGMESDLDMEPELTLAGNVQVVDHRDYPRHPRRRERRY